MFSIKNTIIGLAIFAVGIGSTMFISSLRAEDPRVTHERLRIERCEEIGKLYSKCYSGDAAACVVKTEKQEDYLANYEVSEYIDCEVHDKKVDVADTIAPAAHGVNDEINNGNPLFFGDEEMTAQ
jgi:hypothetical protein